uniref:Uncharacterized protein n=1 Tax=Anguilla anguilla TaxID=7936 RepID=A0A0E9TCT5_ANGAN
MTEHTKFSRNKLFFPVDRIILPCLRLKGVFIAVVEFDLKTYSGSP